jgi:hypothetical protein
LLQAQIELAASHPCQLRDREIDWRRQLVLVPVIGASVFNDKVVFVSIFLSIGAIRPKRNIYSLVSIKFRRQRTEVTI